MPRSRPPGRRVRSSGRSRLVSGPVPGTDRVRSVKLDGPGAASSRLRLLRPGRPRSRGAAPGGNPTRGAASSASSLPLLPRRRKPSGPFFSSPGALSLWRGVLRRSGGAGEKAPVGRARSSGSSAGVLVAAQPVQPPAGRFLLVFQGRVAAQGTARGLRRPPSLLKRRASPRARITQIGFLFFLVASAEWVDHGIGPYSAHPGCAGLLSSVIACWLLRIIPRRTSVRNHLR
ncbi:MAG: hypothetical protein KatS3mg051_0733 [Anaerolineae bacterium]|nr:MAG: hypothetical protein KatS3mg051_0733 [Anaerolineae bacterium]